jgi:hypothetical protein
MTTTPQSPDRNAAADVLDEMERLALATKADGGRYLDIDKAFVWAGRLRAALRAGGEPVATPPSEPQGGGKLRDPELQRQMENAAARGDQINAFLSPSPAAAQPERADPCPRCGADRPGHGLRVCCAAGAAGDWPNGDSALPERAGGGEAFRDSALSSARFRAACYRLVGIVEGVEGMGRRWAANGERLKDTPEWVAFYNAAADMRNGRSLAIPHFADRHEFIHHKADCYTLNGGSGGDEDCNCGAVAFGDALDSLAALNAPPAADGMVPKSNDGKEPVAGFVAPADTTAAMEDAGLQWLTGFPHMRKQDRRNAISNAYRAMLAAAPRQDGAEGDVR